MAAEARRETRQGAESREQRAMRMRRATEAMGHTTASAYMVAHHMLSRKALSFVSLFLLI